MIRSYSPISKSIEEKEEAKREHHSTQGPVRFEPGVNLLKPEKNNGPDETYARITLLLEKPGNIHNIHKNYSSNQGPSDTHQLNMHDSYEIYNPEFTEENKWNDYYPNADLLNNKELMTIYSPPCTIYIYIYRDKN